MPEPVKKPSPKSLPPSLAGLVIPKNRDRNRSRVRLELTVERAMWLRDLITKDLKTLTVDSPGFREGYQIFASLKSQITLLDQKETP